MSVESNIVGTMIIIDALKEESCRWQEVLDNAHMENNFAVINYATKRFQEIQAEIKYQEELHKEWSNTKNIMQSMVHKGSTQVKKEEGSVYKFYDWAGGRPAANVLEMFCVDYQNFPTDASARRYAMKKGYTRVTRDNFIIVWEKK